MPAPGTLFDLEMQMLFTYWAEKDQPENPPFLKWLSQNKVVFYCTSGLDAQATKDIAEHAMQLWADVVDVHPTYVTADDASALEALGFTVIRFQDDETGENAGTDTSDNPIVVNVPPSWINQYGTEISGGTGDGNYLFTTFVHEIGHALGLGHTGNYNADSGSPTYASDALFGIDTWQASIMSYFDQTNYLGNSKAYPMTPQMADILALQSVYGAATNTRTGDTWYGFNSTADRAEFDFASYITPEMTADGGQAILPVALTIYDSGGIDTLDCSGFSQDQNISLAPGTYSDIGGKKGNVGIYGVGGASDTIIENAIGGSGNDYIYGNDADNELHGGAGTDFLYGKKGENTLFGEDGNDHLYGGDNHDVLFGGNDDDVLWGGGDGDYLYGAQGNDTVVYISSPAAVGVNLELGAAIGGDANGDVLSSIENVIGSGYDDILIGNDDNNSLWGGAGNDELHGGGQADSLYGEDGDDTLVDNIGPDLLNGGNNFDTVIYYAKSPVIVDLANSDYNAGEATDDILVSIEKVIADNKDDDELSGDDKDNWLVGTGGNDLLNGRGGSDILDGGADNDTVTYFDAPQGVTADLAQHFGGPTGQGEKGEHDTFYSIENLIGSMKDDYLTGDANDNILEGGEGADTLQGGLGSDTASYAHAIFGVVANLSKPTENTEEAANDSYVSIENITGSTHNDKLTGNLAQNTIDGGGGNDTLSGYGGPDTLDGGDGLLDTASYEDSIMKVTVNLATGTGSGGSAAGDTLKNIECLIGSDYDDTLIGDGQANTLYGALGKDVLAGGGDSDFLVGGDGDDTLDGGEAADTLNGGPNNDTASYAGSALGVIVNLSTGTATGGDAAGDTLLSIENLIGSIHNDKLTGDAGGNTLTGLAGRDTLIGGGGNDTLDGGSNNDTLIGGLGSDEFDFDVGFGIDVVKGFDDKGFDQDVICFHQSVFADFAAVQSAMTQVGSSVFITVDAQNHIELIETNLNKLGADDFLFI